MIKNKLIYFIIPALTILLFYPSLIFGKNEYILRPAYEQVKNVQINNLTIKQVLTPKLGIALSGGGARGFAHIGVLKAFEEHGITVDYIAGTSIGSIIGGLYAVGYTVQEIEQAAKQIKWDDLVFYAPKRTDLFLGQKQDITSSLFQVRFEGLKPYIPQALSAGQRLTNILNDFAVNSISNFQKDFDKFKIPFRSITTDFLTGETVVIDSGNLNQAMLASMSIPLLFTPVEIEGRHLVEGGLTNNIPVDIIEEMGSDITVTINTISPLRKKDDLFFPWEQADQVIGIMQRSLNESKLKRSDVVIKPNLNYRLPTDFSNIEAIINSGYEAAVEKIDEIKSELLKTLKQNQEKNIAVENISIRGLRHRNPETTQLLLNLKQEKYVSEYEIKEVLENIFQSGYFSDVYAVISPPEKSVVFFLEENPVIKSILINGNNVISDEEILSVTRNKEKSIFNSRFWADDYYDIIRIYRNNKYSLAYIESVKFNKSNNTLTIEIDEGIINIIRTEGNNKTKKHVIIREFPLKEGEIFNLEKAGQGITNIFSTGLFERVFLNISRGNPHPDVIINLIEKSGTRNHKHIQHRLI